MSQSKVVLILLTDEYIGAVNGGDELNVCRMEFLEGMKKGTFVIPVVLTSSLNDHPWPGDVGEYLNDHVAIYLQGEMVKDDSRGWGNLLALAVGDTSNNNKRFEENNNGFEELYIHILAKLTNRQSLPFTDNLKASNEAFAKRSGSGTSGVGVVAGAGAIHSIHLRRSSPTVVGLDDADDAVITATTSASTTSTILSHAFMTVAQALVTADDARALIPTNTAVATDASINGGGRVPTSLKTTKAKAPRAAVAATAAIDAKTKTTTTTTTTVGLITTTCFLGDVLTGERDEHGRCHGLAKCVYGGGGGTGGGGGSGGSLVYEGEWQAGRYHGLGYKRWLSPVLSVSPDPSGGSSNRNSNSNSNGNSWVGISSYAGQWRDGLRHGAGVCYYNHNSNNHNSSSNNHNSSNNNSNTTAPMGSDKEKNKDSDNDKDKDKSPDNGSDKSYARYAGFWSTDKFDGNGVLVWAGGDHYTGGFVQGLMHGSGVWYRHMSSSASGDCWYEGEFREGMCEGQGVLKKRHDKGSDKDNGSHKDKGSKKDKSGGNSEAYGIDIPFPSSLIKVYEGAWLQGKRHGYGVEYWPPNTNSVGDGNGGMQQQVRYQTAYNL